MDQRAIRMKEQIKEAFFSCLKEKEFHTLTVSDLTEEAKINRSTFYRHFADKYDLRDQVCDELIRNFIDHMAVDFVSRERLSAPSYKKELQQCLEEIHKQKEHYLVLWPQTTLGRNLFEEMVDAGAAIMKREILAAPHISDKRKNLAEWYARLLINNMLVSIRFWFLHDQTVSTREITELMLEHMQKGTIPTLKNS